ncbi:transposase, partial [Streptacidiphilus melanogenes]|uniref:transposase n=1 Tax=Streptacidiphilus melanogenes TaxID=411235 RepID=UPI0005A96B57
AGAPRHGDPADSWDTVFRDLRNRGLQHVSIVAGNGSARLHAAAQRVWPHTSVHAPNPYTLQRPRPRTAGPPGPQLG